MTEKIELWREFMSDVILGGATISRIAELNMNSPLLANFEKWLKDSGHIKTENETKETKETKEAREVREHKASLLSPKRS